MIDAFETFIIVIFRMFCFMVSIIAMFAGFVGVVGVILGFGFMVYGFVTGDTEIMKVGNAFELMVHSFLGFLVAATIGIPALKGAQID